MTQDLVITPLGDLDLAENGDLKTTDNYNYSIIRRLSTTTSGYARYVNSSDGPIEIDLEYGSDLYNFLSDPITELSDEVLFEAVRKSLAYDSRVVILSVDRESPTLNSVVITIRYRDLETGTVSIATVGTENV